MDMKGLRVVTIVIIVFLLAIAIVYLGPTNVAHNLGHLGLNFLEAISKID